MSLLCLQVWAYKYIRSFILLCIHKNQNFITFMLDISSNCLYYFMLNCYFKSSVLGSGWGCEERNFIGIWLWEMYSGTGWVTNSPPRKQHVALCQLCSRCVLLGMLSLFLCFHLFLVEFKCSGFLTGGSLQGFLSSTHSVSILSARISYGGRLLNQQLIWKSPGYQHKRSHNTERKICWEKRR